MALVLPTLRLWLLLFNVYGTFKAMKPPPQSQRSARNKSGPSARAIQLRKRELKSCLAIWVVWSVFYTLESLLDCTIGLLTPFYNELKCLVLLFLLVARSHGAEAIFLYFIHPFLRPYVHPIDDVLANLYSASDLFLLLLSLPLEYISHWWHQWSWSRSIGKDEDESSDHHDVGGGGEASSEERRVLRSRNAPQQAMMKAADRQAQAVLQDIDNAQARVRARARNQPMAPAVRNDRRNIPNRGGTGVDLDPPAVGLRTRKRVLEYPPAEGQTRGPGSNTTGVHHIHRTALDELPPVPALQPFPNLPTAPTTQPAALRSNPLPAPPQPSTYSSPREIWYPARSAFEGDGRTSPADTPRRTPSPLYPPLPSAYPFTPRLSDPLPPPPRIIMPPNLESPTPRRISTGTATARTGPGRADRFPGRTNQTRPSRTARSADPPGSREHVRQGNVQEEDFFGQALEPAIQAAEMDMDTETISTRDGSSANEDTETGDEFRETFARPKVGGASVTRRGLRSRRQADSEVKKGKRKASTLAEPLRHSTRRRERTISVETDEFGFTIRPGSGTLGSRASASTTASEPVTGPSDAGHSKKKRLARTKPALKADHGDTESSDEESEKKRQRLESDIDEDVTSEAYQDAEADGSATDPDEQESISPDNSGTQAGRGRRNTGVQRTGESQAPRIPKQTGVRSNRATRASTRQTVSAREERLHSAGVTKRARGK